MSKYVLYCTVGNGDGVDGYLGYCELDSRGNWLRYVEIRSDGTALRYREEHAADLHGILPDKPWPADEAVAREFGPVVPITRALFETVWNCTNCLNDPAPGNRVAGGSRFSD